VIISNTQLTLVLVDVDADGRIRVENVHVTDFGVTHWWPRFNPRTGQATRIPGTQYYNAPEVLEAGYAGLSTASDIWAIGCMGYKLFTGVRLFDTVEMIEAYARTNRVDAARLRLVQQDADVTRILSGCLTINPRERWSVWNLLDQLQRVRQRFM